MLVRIYFDLRKLLKSLMAIVWRCTVSWLSLPALYCSSKQSRMAVEPLFSSAVSREEVSRGTEGIKQTITVGHPW